MGEGDFPPELDRVNWGALLFTWIWAWVYGFWWWIGVVAAISVARVVTVGLLGRFVGGAVTLRTWVQTLFDCAGWLAVLYLALNANRLVWASERNRLARDSGGRDKPVPVWKYRKTQRGWTVVGAILGVVIPLVLLRGSFSRRVESNREFLTGLLSEIAVIVGLIVYDRVHLIRRGEADKRISVSL